ncbi:MAG: DUF3857 domain-containing protein [Candidatus Nucleicultricaceae bacterium]
MSDLQRMLLLVLIFFSSSSYAKSDYTIEPLSKWVDIISSEKSSHTSDQSESGLSLSLIDTQTKVDKNTISYFYHFTKKITNHNGIENASSIEIDFYPSRNKVILHYIKIHRGTQTFNQLARENIKTLQRESKLKNNIYTGEKSLCVFLEDVRVGDIIDYAYSVIDPYDNLSDTFFYNIYLNGYYPADQMRKRLLLPKELEISIQNHLTNIKPEIRDSAHYQEYIWEAKNLPMVDIENDTPTWFDPFSWVEVREKKNWHEIALKALESYKTPEALSKELNQYIQDIKDSRKTPSEQFITVMRFIQDKIRYMGINDKFNNFLPTEPSLVFQRRFGDCKDKTLLVLTILRKLGIEASAALVNADKGKILTSYLPSAHIFDHVIIVATMDGKRYWIDPTQSFQRGALENLTEPDYGYALILDAKTTALTKMPEYTLSTPSREIYETFDLRQKNEIPALFTVKTIFKNHSADSVREHFQTKPKNEIQQSYLEYYKTSYPEMTIRKELEIIDNEDLNQITTREEYEIQNPWLNEDAEKRWAFNFYASELRSYTKNDGETTRSMPLSISFPVNILKKIELFLPEKDWDFSPDTLRVWDDAFSYKRKESYKNNVFSVSFDYKTLKDHVTAKNIKEHIENLNKADDSMGGSIYDYFENPTIKKDYINWPVALLLVLSVGILIFSAFKLYSYPMKESAFTPEARYNGLAGWLIIIGIRVLAEIIIEIGSFYESAVLILSTNNWTLLSDSTSVNFHPFRTLGVLIETLFSAFTVVFMVLLSFLFFNKKRLFPSLFIYMAWGIFLWNITDTVLASAIGLAPMVDNETSIRTAITHIADFLSNMLWTAYILESKRVKNTFIKA